MKMSSCFPVRLALSWRARMRGLLRTRAAPEALVLVPCHSIHTFGMRYSIHVAFIDECGIVIKSVLNVAPGRVLRCKGARAVVECASSQAQAWPSKGDSLQFELAKTSNRRGGSHENLPRMQSTVFR